MRAVRAQRAAVAHALGTPAAEQRGRPVFVLSFPAVRAVRRRVGVPRDDQGAHPRGPRERVPGAPDDPASRHPAPDEAEHDQRRADRAPAAARAVAHARLTFDAPEAEKYARLQAEYRAKMEEFAAARSRDRREPTGCASAHAPRLKQPCNLERARRGVRGRRIRRREREREREREPVRGFLRALAPRRLRPRCRGANRRARAAPGGARALDARRRGGGASVCEPATRPRTRRWRRAAPSARLRRLRLPRPTIASAARR